MPEPLSALLLGVAVLSLFCWIGLLLHPARPWDMRPDDEAPAPPDPPAWPSVAVLVPARHEAEMLPHTLPALAAQDYPGEWRIVVVDDRSSDGTAEAARRCGGSRVQVLEGVEPPDGWAGKTWALAQAARERREDYLWLSDADILHAPDSLRRLVAESEAGGLALNSRMARLRCASPAERLLIPAFVWFFTLLYPLRRVNDPTSRRAAAAGGCVLLRRELLDRAGGFEAIRDRIIDDVALARRVRDVGGVLRLALSRGRVSSLRQYGSISSVWTMVRRTAFTQLGRSWAALAGTLMGLALLFMVPPLLAPCLAVPGLRGAGAAALAAWAIMAGLHAPAPRFFGLSGCRAWLLPWIGILYAGITLDSAFRGPRSRWR
jgi:hopene-associated glycosyltransferase HpnB